MACIPATAAASWYSTTRPPASPQVVQRVDDLRKVVNELDRPLGFVPTMGALHDGHLSLVTAAGEACNSVVVSIFVNPTQFSETEDFSAYPRTLDGDLEALERNGVPVDVVWAPTVDDMYPHLGSVQESGRLPSLATRGGTLVRTEGVSDGLEAASRPHFFDGVCTVVTKLINAVSPDAMFLGQKDAQQCAVLRKMSRDLLLPLEVVVVPTVREPSGLALSSRNAYLTDDERASAAAIYQALEHTRAAHAAAPDKLTPSAIREDVAARITAAGGELDYVAASDPETLQDLDCNTPVERALVSVAVYWGESRTRLIDNMHFSAEQSTG
ncbi:pantoate-beta-alanine ligase [Thecamonas trahens ATCC 50062]|uniref:Pantoate--beta-alanine ligase n=1 Tax=Thecamonas trahens ATCC 50062 TaxID=461836 RepID=A0A0L0DEN8_THETB|nr:pantoate-beta-alanine ligase [Thecamonas trahens ATCC 50062]KNC50685.1 pantoate-beta-alanine ligase [Thecamonas trahens ATCC 50062]|eukprot:XP_013762562.1 pantoate-beta-alanine ligase [Thecamonas trahens ATCC 50062]